jgi:hypothetical protein
LAKTMVMNCNAIQGVCEMVVEGELGEQGWIKMGTHSQNLDLALQMEKKNEHWGEVAWSQ